MIALTENDDPKFVGLMERLLASAVRESPPATIYVIRIDQWFDAKWLNFSGKTGGLGVHGNPVTLPPFHPNRVLAEDCFSVTAATGGFRLSAAPPLHREQSSAENLQRHVAKVSASGVFFWYSSSTLGLDRGCAMLYRTDQDEVFTWYASFHRSPEWRVDRHRGISPSELQHRLQCAT